MNANTTVNETHDGWDNDWGSLEEEPINEELEEKANNDINHVAASRSNSNSQSQSHSSTGVYNNNTMNNSSPTKNNGVDTQINSSVISNSNWDNCGTGWNDDEFEPIDETGIGEKSMCNRFNFHPTHFYLFTATSKLDEARRKREEKKIQRQRELEARRAARGPMKLGAKKN
jgi:SCY1-like protein 1